jgi:hypothetical protein
MPDLIKDYFGENNSLEESIEIGQLLQSEGYKCIFEEAMRQKPTCSMALNWCYNEPWPTTANNSILYQFKASVFFILGWSNSIIFLKLSCKVIAVRKATLYGYICYIKLSISKK